MKAISGLSLVTIRPVSSIIRGRLPRLFPFSHLVESVFIYSISTASLANLRLIRSERIRQLSAVTSAISLATFIYDNLGLSSMYIFSTALLTWMLLMVVSGASRSDSALALQSIIIQAGSFAALSRCRSRLLIVEHIIMSLTFQSIVQIPPFRFKLQEILGGDIMRPLRQAFGPTTVFSSALLAVLLHLEQYSSTLKTAAILMTASYFVMAVLAPVGGKEWATAKKRHRKWGITVVSTLLALTTLMYLFKMYRK